MKSRERMLAFFGALFIAFGISSLDLSDPNFGHNSKSYIAIIGGVILMIIFYFNHNRHRRDQKNG